MRARTPTARELFLVEVDQRPDGTVALALSGELDLATLPQFERRLRAAESGDPERILIDLRHLAFIDSTGLHALLATRQRSLEDGRELVLVRGSRAVHRLFEMTGADEMFSFVDAD